MRITITPRGEVTVLEVSGELTWDSVARFSEAVAREFKDGRRDFVVDLRRLEAVDSAGLEAFTALQRQCEEQLGMVRFCGLDSDLLKVLELTRLNRSLVVHNQVEEALASFT